jgi:hypothetical protein
MFWKRRIFSSIPSLTCRKLHGNSEKILLVRGLAAVLGVCALASGRGEVCLRSTHHVINTQHHFDSAAKRMARQLAAAVMPLLFFRH